MRPSWLANKAYAIEFDPAGSQRTIGVKQRSAQPGLINLIKQSGRFRSIRWPPRAHPAHAAGWTAAQRCFVPWFRELLSMREHIGRSFDSNPVAPAANFPGHY